MRNDNFSKELLYSKMCELAKDDGFLAIQKADLAKHCNSYASSSKFLSLLKELEDEGRIKLIQKATRNGQKYWSNWIWEIIKEEKIAVEPIVSSSEISKIDVKDCTEEKFNNITMRLYKINNGYVVPISDISRALQVDRQAIHQLIDRNEELFSSFLVNVTLTNKQGSNPDKCLTKDGVIGLLMKISYKRLPEEKQKLVLDFQKWAIEKLSQLISIGKVELTEQEHSIVQENISETLIFNQFEEEFVRFINSTKQVMKSATEKQTIAERKATNLEHQNQKWISRTQELISKMHSNNIV